MPHPNVELVQRHTAGFAELTPETIRPFIEEFWDPSADYYPARKFPEALPRHGHDEIEGFHRNYIDTWDRVELVVKRVVPIDDVRAFVHAYLHASGGGSGLDMVGDIYQCWWIRSGKALRVEDHLTLEGALNGLDVTAGQLEAAAGS